jgi:hypothetical protein
MTDVTWADLEALRRLANRLEDASCNTDAARQRSANLREAAGLLRAKLRLAAAERELAAAQAGRRGEQ